MDIQIIASGSSGNAYKISDGETSLLLDAGIPIKQIKIALDFSLHKIDGCLITHSHGDHSKSAQDVSNSGVCVYTSSGTIKACALTSHATREIKAMQLFSVGTFHILPFDVQHDAPEPLGFMIASQKTGEKLLYFTDTYYLKYKFAGLNYIMGECNYSEEGLRRSVENGNVPAEMIPRLLKSHMSLENFLEFLKANDLSQVKQIYLLHLSKNNSEADRFKTEVQKLTGTEVYIC